ncbi:hypothetical protein H920_04368 [Fukomys damarensis]|uniref:Uncharacterized protein n=1 Tax=Fukomys damarensis TaxID=885580 RepID=A0A091DQ48_FUKDA|nr:hypothetical protein H920_04368 [Fukomys damarensis]
MGRTFAGEGVLRASKADLQKKGSREEGVWLSVAAMPSRRFPVPALPPHWITTMAAEAVLRPCTNQDIKTTVLKGLSGTYPETVKSPMAAVMKVSLHLILAMVTVRWCYPHMGNLEDVVYHRKPTTLPALGEEIENAGAAISMTKVTQAAVHRTNKCLEADGHQWRALTASLMADGSFSCRV